jgi:DNA-binding CsgD family transcriptional regulator
MIKELREVTALIDGIYESAFDPARWSDTVARITDAVGGSQVMMGIHDFETKSFRAIAPRMDPDHMQAYMSYWGAGDILWQRTNKVPVGKVILAEQFVDRDELRQTGIFNEWYRPMHLGVSGIGVNLFSVNGMPAICGIKRSENDDAFSGNDISLFTSLVPHLMRATDVHRRLWELGTKEGIAASGIDSKCNGVIAVNENGRISYINEIAANIMREPGGLRLESGVLSTYDLVAAKKLQRAIHDCVNRQVGTNSHGTIIVRRINLSSLSITVVPFPKQHHETSRPWQIFDNSAAIVLIGDQTRQRAARKELLQNIFCLTSAEADLALEILRGDGREAAASRLGISLGTARIHLQRVFEKIGVHRQAELVKTLAELFEMKT